MGLMFCHFLKLDIKQRDKLTSSNYAQTDVKVRNMYRRAVRDVSLSFDFQLAITQIVLTKTKNGENIKMLAA